MINIENLKKNYFNLWAYVIPITSFLLIPSIQGTTPAYMFAFLSLGFLFLSKNYRTNLFFTMIILFLYLCVTFLIKTNKPLVLEPYYMYLLTNQDSSLTNTLMTQIVYLLPGILLFLFTKLFYKEGWNKAILYGASFLALYGLYEFIIYLMFQSNGDFISNRLFDEGHPGSWLQTTNFFGYSFARIKSLTGEPSMYAFSILPFWIMSVHHKKKTISYITFISLLLTFSTTAYLGMISYLILRLLSLKISMNKNIILSGYFLIIFFLINTFFQFVDLTGLYSYINSNVIQKIMANDYSGSVRLRSVIDSWELFKNIPVVYQVFGIGFGVIRTTNMYMNFLVNLGVIGLITIVIIFVYPIIKLFRTEYRWLSFLLITILVSFMAVPEFSYLPHWLFLGIAYNRMKLIKEDLINHYSYI